MKNLLDLPVIVDAPGEYVARSGARVRIEIIPSEGTPSKATFDRKGYYYPVSQTASGNPHKPKWGIWHASGRYGAVTEHARDIVRKEETP